MILYTLFIVFVVCLIIGVPISFSLGISSFVSLLLWAEIPVRLIVQRMFTGVDSFTLMALPFFMLAGELMMESKILDGLMKFAEALVGRIRGALGHVIILTCALFASIIGSALAEVAALGRAGLKMMEDAGYEKDYSAALTAAASTVGPIIPPSIPMVVYAAVVGNVSIAGLFLAGFLPGALLSIAMMVYHYVVSVKRNCPYRTVPISFGEFLRVFKEAILALLMPAIILGGILGGIFTATEASAVACAYAFFIGVFVTRKLNFKKFCNAVFRSGIATGMALLLVATANIFSWILATQQVPQRAANFFLSLTHNPLIYLLLVNILLLIVGCFMDTTVAIIIFSPILAPVAAILGVEPLQFGIIVCFNLVIGLITPPVGLCLFMVCAISGLSLEKVTKRIWPFVLIQIGVLFLITYVPSVSLFIPKSLGYIR